MPLRVLLLDDNEAERALARQQLVLAFPEVFIEEVLSLEAFQEQLQQGTCDLVITDYQLGWASGLDIVQAVKARDPNLPVILLTGSGSEEVVVEAVKKGVDDYVLKTSAATGQLAASAKRSLETARYRSAAAAALDRYRSLFNSVPIGLFRLAPDDTVRDMNPAFARTLGLSDQFKPAGLHFGSLFVREEDRHRWQEHRRDDRQLDDFEVQLRRPDGSEIWVWISGHSAPRQGALEGLYFEGSLLDVTERLEASRSLELYADRLSILREIDKAILGSRAPEEIARATLHHIQQLIPSKRGSVAVFDLKANQMSVFATYGDPMARLGTGTLLSPQTFGDLKALKRGEPVVVHDTGDLHSPSAWGLAIMAEGTLSYLKVPLLAGGQLIGSLNLEADHAHAYTAEHLEAATVVADSLAVAIQQAQLSESVHRLAITDGLTGLYNRRYLFELGEQEFKRARRYDRSLAAIMLDIDSFKRVNDVYGHASGDDVLHAVADRCKRTLRDIDILGRYGGEEFAVLLPETDLEAACGVAERLRLKVGDELIQTRTQNMQITISLGVAQRLVETANLAQLLDRADTAMYRAKQAGRNRVRSN